MKVILNEDVKYLGEEGDVKVVAAGYARNYLLPRGLVVRYNPEMVKLFEAKKAEIEARKEVKRQNARSVKEKLESTTFEVLMSASGNGKLYGAVTATVLSEILKKNGFDIERKRIEIQGPTVKSVGTYHATLKLYEAESAEITFTVRANITEKKDDGTVATSKVSPAKESETSGKVAVESESPEAEKSEKQPADAETTPAEEENKD